MGVRSALLALTWARNSRSAMRKTENREEHDPTRPHDRRGAKLSWRLRMRAKSKCYN